MDNNQKNLAFVFPGQGSQAVGMLNDMATSYPEIKQTFAKASDVLGQDLWQLVSDGPEEALNQTQITQPAMLAAGVAVWEVWCKLTPVRPNWMAGHSLGEYSALVCSGALGFEDAVRLVAERARLMQAAVPAGVGAMAAILGLEDAQVIEACAAVSGDEIVEAVNFNAPGQVVIAGHKAAVERACESAKAVGAKRAVLLPVSVPSHCALMKTAADKFAASLQEATFAIPNIPVIHNVDVQAHREPEAIRAALTAQLYQPVRWVETVSQLNVNGISTFVECGPGKVLTGLGKRIAKEAGHLSVYDLGTLNKVLEQLHDD